MHSKKVLHRDLKTQNIFLDKSGTLCKLGTLLLLASPSLLSLFFQANCSRTYKSVVSMSRLLVFCYFSNIGDFGIAKSMDTTIEVASTCVGTPCYLSPEMCQDIPYSSKADIWVQRDVQAAEAEMNACTILR